jgi:predicted enzyme related to lactoylglutathione lyase
LEIARGRVRSVIYPADDLDGSIEFYSRAFGLMLRFRDGDRFAMFEGEDVPLALAVGHESLASTVAASISVGDLDASVKLAVSLGGELLLGPQEGPHEIRALVCDPAGNPILVYQARPT